MQSAMPSAAVATGQDEPAALPRLAKCLQDLPEQGLEEEQTQDLRSYLDMIPDPRDRRGRRHPLAAVLFLACAAMLTGKVSITAIARWIGGAGQEVLALAGTPARSAERTVPAAQ